MKVLFFMFAAVLGVMPTVQAATLYSCPNSPAGGGDGIDRGFYVTDYPGATLDTITLTKASARQSRQMLSFFASLPAQLLSAQFFLRPFR